MKCRGEAALSIGGGITRITKDQLIVVEVGVEAGAGADLIAECNPAPDLRWLMMVGGVLFMMNMRNTLITTVPMSVGIGAMGMIRGL